MPLSGPGAGGDLISDFDPLYGEGFPIAEYDELRVSEIMPLLPELYPEEIPVVRARELAGRGRSTILRRLDDLERRWAQPGKAAEPAEPAVGLKLEFPIADYEKLRVADILPLLPQLGPEELEVVKRRELAGASRVTILRRLDVLVG